MHVLLVSSFLDWDRVSQLQHMSVHLIHQDPKHQVKGYKQRAIDSTVYCLRAFRALRTAAVTLPHLGTLADHSSAAARRLLLSILGGAAAQSPLLSSDPNAHVCGIGIAN